MSDEEIEKKFKLDSNLNCTNMVLFDKNYNIKKYDNECEILDEFYQYRYLMYNKRRDYMLKKIKQEYDKFHNQFRFVSEIINGKLEIYKKKKD